MTDQSPDCVAHLNVFTDQPSRLLFSRLSDCVYRSANARIEGAFDLFVRQQAW